MTHTKLVALIADSLPLELQLRNRFSKFIVKALNHDNSVVSHVTKQACINPMSVCGRNWRDFILPEMSGYAAHVNYQSVDYWIHSLTLEERDKCGIIREMLLIREGRASCNLLTQEEVDVILHWLCTE